MTTRKYNVQNLKPFKKGVTDPRHLVPKKKRIPELKVLLENIDPKDWDLAMKNMLRIAKQGKDSDALAAINLMMDRAYGKPNQAMSHKVDIATPIIIDWNDSDSGEGK